MTRRSTKRLRLVKPESFQACSFCQRTMRTLANQRYLLSLYPKLFTSVEDVQKGVADLCERAEGLCSDCVKFTQA